MLISENYSWGAFDREYKFTGDTYEEVSKKLEQLMEDTPAVYFPQIPYPIFKDGEKYVGFFRKALHC